LSLFLIALGLVVIFLKWSTPLPTGWYPWSHRAIEAVGLIGAPILGGLIASRRPENPYGWLWLGAGIGWALTLFAQAYALYALVVAPGTLPAPRTVAVLVQSVGWLVVIIIAPFLLLLFPNGRLPARRWRLLAWSIIAVGAVLVIFIPLKSDLTEQFVNLSA
jgi:two-component system, NarL family, sensor kinase